MKLNNEVHYITRNSGGNEADVCRVLAYRLPSLECLTQPEIVVVQYNGVYYVVKSRCEIAGDPYNIGNKPVNPYELEFTDYTLHELSSMCHVSKKPKLFRALCKTNVLVYM